MKLALRRLRSRPGFTALIVLVIAVGVGAATTVFSVVDQLLLRPPPFAHADRLVDVLDTTGSSLTPGKIAGWQQQAALFERLEGYMPMQFDVTGDAEPERIMGQLVSLGLFPMLGVEPRLGRTFTSGDGRPGSERVTIISDEIWRRRFGAERDVIGRSIVLNDQDYTVVGVMPRRFRLQGDRDTVWVPIDIEANRGDRSLDSFYAIGRLAPGVTAAAAPGMAKAIADRMQKETPIPRSWELAVEKKQAAWVDQTTRTALFVLLGAVAFVLFITCANVANLFLSLAPLRLREMAICSALGSARGRLVGGVLAEALLLAGAGGALGVLFARWGVQVMIAGAPQALANWSTTPIDVDGRVVAVAVAMTAITGVVIGVLPAIRGSRANVETTLRASAAAVRSSYGRTPAALVVVEVAFSVVLLVGAALMARTLVNLHAIDPGFEPEGLVAMHVDLPTDRYPDVAARLAFFDEVFAKVGSIPGVTAVAAATGTPPRQGGFTSGQLEGEGSRVAPAPALVPRMTVSSGYFHALGIPLLAGRDFAAADTINDVIVSRGLADRLWPGENAVGRRFRVGAKSPWRTIVGVAGNVETRGPREDRTVLQMYSPWVAPASATATVAAPPAPRRRGFDYRLLIVRAASPSLVVPVIQRQIWALDAKQPIERIALVSDLYGEAFARQRFVLTIMGAFSAIAIALTAAGIFGVLSQVVRRRTREIGIRMVLGARPSDVMRQVLRSGLTLSLLGAAIGIGAALPLSRVLRTLLFGVSPMDPISFGAVTLLLVAVAVAACWLPARAAMRVEPAAALRVE